MHHNAFFPILCLLMGVIIAAPAPKIVVSHRSISHDVSIAQTLTTVGHFSSNPTTTANTIAPTHTAPSTCTTYYPTILRQLLEAVPNVMQDNVANTTKAFHVAQSVSYSDGVKFDRIHQYVAFENITGGSWDCQLMVSWPDTAVGDIAVSTSSRHGSAATSSVSLDVYSASYNTSAYAALTTPKGAKVGTPNSGPFATWDSMMGAIKVGGNNQLGAKGDSTKSQDKSATSANAKLSYFGTVAVNPGEYGITVNSEACPSSDSTTLAFLFEIPNTDSRDASVSFLAEKEKGAGVYLLADC